MCGLLACGPECLGRQGLPGRYLTKTVKVGWDCIYTIHGVFRRTGCAHWPGIGVDWKVGFMLVLGWEAKFHGIIFHLLGHASFRISSRFNQMGTINGHGFPIPNPGRSRDMLDQSPPTQAISLDPCSAINVQHHIPQHHALHTNLAL